MRNILAIVGAFTVTGALALATGYLLIVRFPAKFDDLGATHDIQILVAVLITSIFYNAVGGYVAVYLSNRFQIRNAVIFGIVMLVVNAVGTAAKFHTAPPWYHIANLLFTVPATVLGGQLRVRQQAARYNSPDE